MTDPQATARDEFFESLLGDFLDESGQLLDRLNERLLQLDAWVWGLGQQAASTHCDDELLNDMFRAAHSLKGLSAMLGLTEINTLTHKVENVFDAARKDELHMTGDVVELVFQAVDRLGGLVELLKDPEAPAVECESVVENIGKLLQSAGAERMQTTQADAEQALVGCTATTATAGGTDGNMEIGAEDGAGTPVSSTAATVNARARNQSEVAEITVTEATAAQVDADAADAVKDTAEARAPQEDLFAGLEDGESPSKYLPIFIDEAELSLDHLAEILLACESGSSLETVEKLMVVAHRIKGSAATVGLNRAAKLAHFMEDLLQNLSESGQTLTPQLADAMLACVDGLRQYVEGLKHGNASAAAFNTLAHGLLAARARAVLPPAPKTASKPSRGGERQSSLPREAAGQKPRGPSAAKHAVAPPAACGISRELHVQVARVAVDQEATLVGAVNFEPELPFAGLKARLLYEKLSNLGEICYFTPSPEQLDDLDALEGIGFGLTTTRSHAAVGGHLRVAGVRQVTVEPLTLGQADAAPATPPAPAESKPREPAASRAAAADAARPNATESSRDEAAGSTAERCRSADSGKPAETLRVDIERLDQLMNLAGQLVINKARFARIGDKLKSAATGRRSTQVLDNVFSTLEKALHKEQDGSSPGGERAELENLRGAARRIAHDLEVVRQDVAALGQVRAELNNLLESIHQLDRISDAVQQSVMDTRMLPIGPLFTRFKRVIRDLTRGNGKTIHLEISGEKTELDKRMIDELSDPLIHLVRNSADHGIESPEIRAAAGKPAAGTVTLDAFHRGNSIIIRVSDDGKGLDVDRIRRKAVEKGLLSEADAEKLTPRQVCQLIWEPGLSTAEKVTEVSGRGMGMDIVKSKIEDLNGTVELDSEMGRGTTFTIKLPLTLAILPSLMVRIDEDVFAMPLESVVEIVCLKRRDVTTVQGRGAARVRGRVVPVVNLHEVFAWSRSRPAESRSEDDITLVVIGGTGQEIGLTVHHVLGEEDVVIKSMAENYRNVPGIAGASILGDGRVSLILDLAALIEMARPKT